MTKASQYHYCTVGPTAAGDVALSPGASYRLDLEAPALQAPVDQGAHHHAVVSEDELTVLRRRGFTVTLKGGPFSSLQDAEDCLDDWWEDSHRMGGDG